MDGIDIPAQNGYPLIGSFEQDNLIDNASVSPLLRTTEVVMMDNTGNVPKGAIVWAERQGSVWKEFDASATKALPIADTTVVMAFVVGETVQRHLHMGRPTVFAASYGDATELIGLTDLTKWAVGTRGYIGYNASKKCNIYPVKEAGVALCTFMVIMPASANMNAVVCIDYVAKPISKKKRELQATHKTKTTTATTKHAEHAEAVIEKETADTALGTATTDAATIAAGANQAKLNKEAAESAEQDRISEKTAAEQAATEAKDALDAAQGAFDIAASEENKTDRNDKATIYEEKKKEFEDAEQALTDATAKKDSLVATYNTLDGQVTTAEDDKTAAAQAVAAANAVVLAAEGHRDTTKEAQRLAAAAEKAQTEAAFAGGPVPFDTLGDMPPPLAKPKKRAAKKSVKRATRP